MLLAWKIVCLWPVEKTRICISFGQLLKYVLREGELLLVVYLFNMLEKVEEVIEEATKEATSCSYVIRHIEIESLMLFEAYLHIAVLYKEYSFWEIR
ncbi:hypothetical protein NMG60_11027542 [Bertholletia excelsa]